MKKIIRKISLLGLGVALLINIVSTTYIASQPNSTSTVRAQPSVGQEAGIWINKYEIVLYNNVLRNGKTSTTIAGKSYDVYSAGEVFRNVDYKSGKAKSNFKLDTEDLLPIGDTQYKNEAGCASITFSGSKSTGSLSSTCPGRTLSTSVTMERTDSAKIDSYINGDSIYMPLYVSNVTGIPNNPEEGSSVNGTLSSAGTFSKQDGDNASNSGYAKREYTNCKDGKCYGQSGTPGSKGATWARVISGAGTQLPTIIQARRDDNSGSSYCKGDCSATIVVKSNAINGREYTQDIQAQVEKTQEFQNSQVKRVAFREFFAGADQLSKAKFCASTLSRSFSVEYTIDTLVKPIPGPYYDCLLKAFADNSTFSDINSIAGEAVALPGALTDDVGDQSCGSGAGSIPIISDLVCGMVKWLFNMIFEVFTGVINWLAAPPDMFAQQNGTLEQSIKNLRNIANVIFILAFLMVVLQYLTNINVADAYFIKKFIPKLIIAVILTQASFWITSELNYFFYDLGRSVQSIVFFGQSPGTLSLGNGAATIALFAGPGALGMVLIIGLLMAIMLLITLVVLAIRYILIIVLAILSPLALAAFAIPQLEGLTKKWLKTYVTLLMMYPIIMFFIAASSIVGGVFSGGGTILQFMGLIVQFLPFIALPFTFKFAGGMMGTIGAKFNPTNLAKKGYGNYKKAEGMYESKTDKGRARAADRKNREAIKGQRAHEAGSERTLNRMRGASGSGLRDRMTRRSIYGNGNLEDAEMRKSQSILEGQEKKRKQEEAELQLADRLKGATSASDTTARLDAHYRSAMASGDSYAAGAAYNQLVGMKANNELEAIQNDANNGMWSGVSFGETTDPTTGAKTKIDGRSVYNSQQGDNYGKLGEFAPHIRGDVDGSDINAKRKKALESMSDDALSAVNADTWKTYHAIDPSGAAARYVGIHAKGGGSASRLTPDAKATLATDPTAARMLSLTDAAIEGAHAGIADPDKRAAAIDIDKAERNRWKNALT